jgi:AraC-like DNA-binding protein
MFVTPDRSPLLERYRVFASRDVDELRTFLASKDFRLDDAPRDRARFYALLNGVYMPGMYLGYHEYGSRLTIRADGRDDYWLQLPISGTLELADSRNSTACDTRRAALASPTNSDHYLVKSEENCGGVRVCLFRSALTDCLAGLLGDAPRKPLVFAPELDLSRGHGRSLAQHILLAVRDLDRPGTGIWTEATKVAFQQFVMTALLMAQPHSYSERIERLDRRAAPRDVKRAIDFIQANIAAPITIHDIVTAAGAPGRTLFKHFEDFKGVSPMRYLRNLRFDLARKRLLAADPGADVTRIAMEAGFSHMGRFAAGYRARFGESPSMTLRRGQARR